LVSGQNQINTRMKTLAPNPMTCTFPKLPSFQAVQAKKTTIARTAIINAKRILFVSIMSVNLPLAGVALVLLQHRANPSYNSTKSLLREYCHAWRPDAPAT